MLQHGSRKHNTEKEHMYTDIQNQCVCMAGVMECHTTMWENRTHRNGQCMADIKHQ